MTISKTLIAFISTFFLIQDASSAVLQWDGLDENQKKVYFAMKDGFFQAYSGLRFNVERMRNASIMPMRDQTFEFLPDVLRKSVSQSREKLSALFDEAPRLMSRREGIVRAFDLIMERYMHFVMPLLDETLPLMEFFDHFRSVECTGDNYGTTGQYASTTIATGHEKEQLLAYNGFDRVYHALGHWGDLNRYHVLPSASDWGLASFIFDSENILLGRKIAPINQHWLRLLRFYSHLESSEYDITSAKLRIIAHTAPTSGSSSSEPFKPSLTIVHYNSKNVVASLSEADFMRLSTPFEFPREHLVIDPSRLIVIPTEEAPKTIRLFTESNVAELGAIDREIDTIFTEKSADRAQLILSYGNHLSTDFMDRLNAIIEGQFKVRAIKHMPIAAQKARDPHACLDLEGPRAAIFNLHTWMTSLIDRSIGGTTKPRLTEAFDVFKTSCCLDRRYPKLFNILLMLKEIDESYADWPASSEKDRVLGGLSGILSAAMYRVVDHQDGHWNRDEGNVTTLGWSILTQMEILTFFKDAHPSITEE